MKHRTGEQYNPRVELEADSYRDKQFLEEERLQNEYEEACERKSKELLRRLNHFQIKNCGRLCKEEWCKLREYFFDYEIKPNIEFEKIIDDYIDEVVRKYDFLYKVNKEDK